VKHLPLIGDSLHSFLSVLQAGVIAAGSMQGSNFVIPPRALSLQGHPASFPLRFSHANQYFASRLCLIGDAAHTVHPLAGQGLNLGIGDVSCLHETLAYGIKTGQDIGSPVLLQSYESERKKVDT
jgi:ubiquinone biosynthesis monooxygenase Coq6